MPGRPNVKKIRRTLLLILTAVVLLACAESGSAPALAQERGSAASAQEPERRGRPGPGHPGPPSRFERRPGRPRGRFPGGHLFRPMPEDEGPLAPGELRELLGFVRRHVPYVHHELRKLRKSDPTAFHERIEEAAPRLRQLRRIFERNPELGQRFVRHSENMHRIGRARQAWIDSGDDPEMRGRILLAVRRMVAENVRIETAVLADRAEQLTEEHDRRVEAEFERLQDDATDLADEPNEVRELVAALHAAQGDDEREALTGDLRQICAERLDREIAHLQEHAARMRANAAEEVDHRMKRLTRSRERGPRGRGAPMRDGQHGPDDGGRGDNGDRRGRSPGRRP